MCGRSPPWVGASPTFKYLVRTSLNAWPRRTAGLRRSGVAVLIGCGSGQAFEGFAEEFGADVVQLAFEPGEPGVGVAGADGQLDPVGGVFVGFPVQVQGLRDGFRERGERFRVQDASRCRRGPSWLAPASRGRRAGRGLDGGHDGADLFGADRPFAPSRRRVPAVPGRFSSPVGWICGRIIDAAFTRVLASAAEMRQGFPEQGCRWRRTRTGRRCCRVSTSPATRTCAV